MDFAYPRLAEDMMGVFMIWWIAEMFDGDGRVVWNKEDVSTS